jgi:hypothetical protein
VLVDRGTGIGFVGQLEVHDLHWPLEQVSSPLHTPHTPPQLLEPQTFAPHVGVQPEMH